MVNAGNRSHTSWNMAHDLKHAIGLRLRNLRNVQNITQETLEEMIERTPETVSNIERGKFLPSLDTLERISKGLHISLSSFFEKDEHRSMKFVRSYEIEFRLRKALEPLTDEDIETALRLLETFSSSQKKKGSG